ncbi:MAG: hypothetical protein KC550_06280 [Nanoarchaeota archaeon]|nr:hypothetical protein [Nanoarchaeota archaeon]
MKNNNQENKEIYMIRVYLVLIINLTIVTGMFYLAFLEFNPLVVKWSFIIYSWFLFIQIMAFIMRV